MVPGVGEVRAAFQLLLAGERDALPEVGQVVVVRDVVDVRIGQPSLGRVRPAAVAQRAAHAGVVAVPVPVVRQDLPLQGSPVPGLEVTELAPEGEPPLGHEPGRQGRVPVRGDVEVVGHRQLEAGAPGLADGGRQESRLPPVVDREGDVGEVGDGHLAKAQLRTAGRAEALGLVYTKFVGRDQPAAVPGRAGGVGQLPEERPLGVLDLHGGRLSAGRRGGQPELHILRRTSLGGQVEPGAGAREPQPRLMQGERLVGDDQVARAVVLDLLGPNPGVAVVEFDGTGEEPGFVAPVQHGRIGLDQQRG